MSRIPDIPGFHVPRGSDQESWLKSHVARLCHLDHNRYVPVFYTSAAGPLDNPSDSQEVSPSAFR